MKSNKNFLRVIAVYPKKGILARLEFIALWKWATHVPVTGNAVVKFGVEATQLLYS